MGIDWGEYRPGRSAVVIGNFANEPDTLLLPGATRAGCSSPTWPLAEGLAGPSRSLAQVRPVLLRLRPRRPARPADLQRPPRAGHRQGAAGPDLRSSRRSCSGTPASSRRFEPVTADAGRAGPVPAAGRPRLRLRRHRRRRLPRRGADRQRRPGAAAAQRGRHRQPLAAAEPGGRRQALQPQRHRRPCHRWRPAA